MIQEDDLTVTTPATRVLDGVGIGLRLPHIAEVAATRPRLGWLEIHPENFLANPHALELLTELRHVYPISLHTVGISVGSAHGIDRPHLKRIRKLVDRIDPVFISGHLAWSTHLLPLPLNMESLRVVATHVNEVQDALGRPYLVENPASYVAFADNILAEAEFLSELVLRTGCRLLCDVSNVVVSAHNMGYDPYLYVDSLLPDAIAELHLGGYTAEEDFLIDTHAAAVADRAWELYAYAVQRFGAKPALIEWDNEIPPLAILVGEAKRAVALKSDVTQLELAVPTLAETQLFFRDAVVKPDTTRLAALLAGGPDSEKGLGIHQRNFETGLVTALLTKFPATAWLTGSSFVSEAAKLFVHERPPHAPCIAEYGQDFPAFIAALPGAERVPYLAEFSDLEWQVSRASVEINEQYVTLDELSFIDQELLPEMVLRLQPCVRYREASWSVDELLKLFVTGTAPERYTLENRLVWLEIRGARGEFRIDRLEASEFVFRKSISEGCSLGAAAESALDSNVAFDAGQALIRVIHAGLVKGIEPYGGQL